ncbi:MAG: 2OG-Fe(II) oxygenase [Acetobacteraceae bacterium]
MPSSFFRMITLPAADAALWPRAIRRMRDGDYEGVLVQGVYTQDECARLCARLEAGDHGLVRMGFPAKMRSFFLGMNLNLTPDLAAYFREAPRFRAGLQRLFDGSTDLETRVASLLSLLDGGRPYSAPPGPGEDHMFTTLRGHRPEGFIPPHFDNEQAFRDSYRFITPLIGADLFSFVLAFSRAEAGGALEVFNLHHGGRRFRMADGPDDASHLDLDGVESVRFRLAPGDLILFNSGRLLHRVTPVIGSATRWTACSFMAESRTGDRVYCWG